MGRDRQGLKPVYTAQAEAVARERFAEFAEAWGVRYPAIVRLWENVWAEFVLFLAVDPEIRRVICSTNAVESVNGNGLNPTRGAEEAPRPCPLGIPGSTTSARAEPA
ncbi:hypothetical protein Acsp05_02720 [Actinokineospora sp. NBRC 105648]|nr:hypothetical protein Acsp05_02720 [Actinokineospora sp. NBRC 105648]